VTKDACRGTSSASYRRRTSARCTLNGGARQGALPVHDIPVNGAGTGGQRDLDLSISQNAAKTRAIPAFDTVARAWAIGTTAEEEQRTHSGQGRERHRVRARRVGRWWEMRWLRPLPRWLMGAEISTTST
jgi:hypothetical protein